MSRYSILRAVKARECLPHSTLIRFVQVPRKVVCNSWRLQGAESLPEVNANCVVCGRRVWCPEVWMHVRYKVCVRCEHG